MSKGVKALLDGQSALLQGVNDIRANVVTRQQLQAFHDLQATEMRTYVQAELAPVHNTLRQYSADVGSMAERMSRIESRVDAGGVMSEARPEIHDPARRRVAFIGFGAQTSAHDRISAMEVFMRDHFPAIKPVSVNLFPDKEGRPSVHGFVECCSPQQTRMILDSIKTQNLRLGGHDGVNIKPALTDIDKNRNWAIFAAEEKVKASPQAQGKHVSVKKSGKGRVVYANDVAVFTQVERHARGVVFLSEYAHLSLS